MSKPARLSGLRGGISRWSRFAVIIGVAMSIAGCSSAVTRFDFPVFGLNDDKNDSTASVRPEPSKPIYSGSSRLSGSDLGQSYEPRNYSSYAKSSAPIEPVERYANRPAPYSGKNGSNQRMAAVDPKTYTRSETRHRSLTQTIPARPKQVAKADGGWVTVQPGDTLYSLSRRYGVSMTSMMAANNLSDTNIQIGQRLAVPGQQPAAPVTYRVQQGDTMYSIARRLGVGQREIAQANGISDPTRIRPGQVLKVPEGAKAQPTRVASIESPSLKSTAATRPTPSVRRNVQIGGAPQHTPRRVNTTRVPVAKPTPKPQPTKRVASIKKLPKPASRSNGRFRWPVRGRVISKFGAKSNGSHNDGINIAVPLGTSVKAVENGVVAYAGNELKGYGNLILIRHADNWVSAYAHNSKILVKRGDKISRGQIIAKAGKSGAVNQPQVHFELRKGSKPVNPLKHMDRI